jgi:hypothetical protein
MSPVCFVLRWPFTSEDQIRTQASPYGNLVDKVARGRFFRHYFGFPRQNHSINALFLFARLSLML